MDRRTRYTIKATTRSHLEHVGTIANLKGLIGAPFEIHVICGGLGRHVFEIGHDIGPDFLEALMSSLSQVDPDVSHGSRILDFVPVL
jgi:hypothetical protein